MIALVIASLALGQLSLRQDGGVIGQVSAVNCVGPNVTCGRGGSTWNLSVSASAADPHALLSATHTDTIDAGPVDDTVLVANGTAWQSKAMTNCADNSTHIGYSAGTNEFACYQNTVTGGSCAAGSYATAVSNQAAPTCAQVQTSQLGGTVTDAQLASNYSGVGACAAGSVVSAVNDNGAPTCVDNNAAVGGTCAVGDVVTAVSATGATTCSKPITGGACGASDFVKSVSNTGAITCGLPTIVGGTCAAGSYMTGINSRGEITCANTCPGGCV